MAVVGCACYPHSKQSHTYTFDDCVNVWHTIICDRKQARQLVIWLFNLSSVGGERHTYGLSFVCTHARLSCTISPPGDRPTAPHAACALECVCRVRYRILQTVYQFCCRSLGHMQTQPKCSLNAQRLDVDVTTVMLTATGCFCCPHTHKTTHTHTHTRTHEPSTYPIAPLTISTPLFAA